MSDQPTLGSVILFDFVGTLARLVRGQGDGVYDWLIDQGVETDWVSVGRGWDMASSLDARRRDQYLPDRQSRQRRLSDFATDLLLGAGIPDQGGRIADSLAEADTDTYALYPDVRGALETLHACGFRMAIVSNWDRPSLSDQCLRLGIGRLFDVIMPSVIAESDKPDPWIFRQTLKELGVNPTDAIHVGDTPQDDVRGAQAAGIKPILIRRHPSESPKGDTTTIGDLHELMSILAPPESNEDE
jgi:putative hydrolase of the HAD superfamily